MEKSSRVYTIELWRFIFCIVVLGFHIGAKFDLPLFTAGYLGVEFFFILSGYGIGVYYIRHIQDKAFGQRWYQLGIYIGKRLQQLYPLYFTALIIMLIIRGKTGEWGVSGLITYLKNGWAEFIMMQCGPLGGEVLVSADWYVASVFWGGIIMLLILIFTGKLGGLVIGPLASIGIYTYYFKLICKIDVIFSYHAVLRGLAGINVGVFICFLIQFFEQKQFTAKWKKKETVPQIFYVLANIVLLAVVIYTYAGHRGFQDFVVIGLYTVALFILLITKEQLSSKTAHILKVMGKTTYPIYILHMPVLEFIAILV